MNTGKNQNLPDFQGIGYSKIGYFKEVRHKIKELEKLNIKLARRHNRLEAIFNSMSDGVTILDKEFNIVFANHVQKTMFSTTPLIGTKCFQAYYQREDLCRNCPSLKTREEFETLRGEVLIKSGKLAGRYIEWTTSPIKDLSGNVDEIILLMRDITERKEYEYKLMQADRMAAIGFLTAGISHEINNPLTSIAGFSEGLLKRLAKDEFTFDRKMKESFREYLQIIHAEAYRCKEIIQNLKEFSHNSIDDFTIVHIDQIIRDTISLFRQHAKDHNIEIAYTNHFSKEFNTIYGKESQLKHLFLNLFNRALKSMEEGGVLMVKTTYRESQIEISISDTGSASALNQNCKIFNPLDRERAGDRASGIDLSICYSIVQHHRGDIRFKHTDDGHNIFILNFPFNL